MTIPGTLQKKKRVPVDLLQEHGPVYACFYAYGILGDDNNHLAMLSASIPDNSQPPRNRNHRLLSSSLPMVAGAAKGCRGYEGLSSVRKHPPRTKGVSKIPPTS